MGSGEYVTTRPKRVQKGSLRDLKAPVALRHTMRPALICFRGRPTFHHLPSQNNGLAQRPRAWPRQIWAIKSLNSVQVMNESRAVLKPVLG